ncbi:MAG: TetR/AcrR family transcriptional regulator [Streptococcaceae bacterium]|nr:TetR/AcrR family transcriptional regulator [Streptococcaceae bacterium]MCL2858244.1 TetR/AcrR family transcriptional regulator [Streptococcaceae bacterium]
MNQTEKKKKAILDVTLKLLKERKISEISMDEIAKKAIVSKVTIFNYYENKNNLINLVLKAQLGNMTGEIESILAEDLNFIDTYYKVSDFKLKQIKLMTDTFVHNLMQQYATSPDFFDTGSQQLQAKLYQTLFEKGRAEGKISPDYKDEELYLYLELFNEGLKTVSIDKLLPHAEHLAQMFLNGLQKPQD